MATRLRIRYVRSAIGRTKQQKDTIAALGLRRIGEVIEHEDNPAIRGMIRKVGHLVKVQEVQA
jgi:large subunit ribosomal protein L30